MASCITEWGYEQGEILRRDAIIVSARAKKVEAIAIAIANANQLMDNYKKQRDISSDTLKLSEEMLARSKRVFWPRELEFLAEFGVQDLDIEDADRYGRRYAGRLVASVANHYAKEIHNLKCNQSRYCTSNFVYNLQGLMMAKSEAIANMRVQGRLIGFTVYMAKKDRNFERRMKAIALGKNLLGAAASLYKSAAGGIAMAGRELSRDFGGALEMFGAADAYMNSKYGALEFKTRAEDIAEETVRQQNAADAYKVSQEGSDPSLISQIKNEITSVSEAWDESINSMLGNGAKGGLAASESSIYSTSLASAASLSTDNMVSRSAQPTLYNYTDMSTDSRNQTNISKASLARSGDHTYGVDVRPAVVGDHGAHSHSATVTVSMTDFPLHYTDRLNSDQKDMSDSEEGWWD